jgi:PKD domain/Glycosyl hydrolases family 39
MFVQLLFPNAVRNACLSFALAFTSLLSVSVVQSQTVSADFANRSGATPVIPGGFFGIGGVGTSLSDMGTIRRLTAVGLNETRFWISLSQIYAKKNPNFRSIDQTLQRMKSAGLHPIGVIYGTPPSLGSAPCAQPSDIWQWGQMAASVVAHVDQNFPGILEDYEIWNEPELTGSLCISDDTVRLNTYVSMFAAAASAMHAQAQADGEPIHTGGPVISQIVHAPVWIPALLNNDATAPYVDFVSFHLYLTGQVNIDEGMTWSDLYAITQSNTRGLAHYYQAVEPLVRAGNQPNAASTPIYISEYNDNWAFSEDCCRNHPAYSPVWNSLGITDFLNVVYSGATAVPSRLVYFNILGNSFCMFGEWNVNMDCNSTVKDPYPQFFVYELFASSDYLDLQAGGHMAASVSPGSTTNGLQATAFYTNNADSVVIVNSTSTTYDAVTVNLTNPGLTSAAGEAYLLDSSHGRISGQSVSLNSISGGYSAEVDVPAYSTVALSVKDSSSGNPPTAVLTVTPQSGTHPLTVNIDSSQSQRGGSYISGRTIDFGDGKWISWTPATSHTYNNAGNYTIRLAVKNQSGQISTATSVVTVY